MAGMDMSIIEKDDLIKKMPRDALKEELRNPSGNFPLFLVAARLKEVEEMQRDLTARQAASDSSNEAGSVAERLAQMSMPESPMSQMAAAPTPEPRPDAQGIMAQQMAGPTQPLPTVMAATGMQGRYPGQAPSIDPSVLAAAVRSRRSKGAPRLYNQGRKANFEEAGRKGASPAQQIAALMGLPSAVAKSEERSYGGLETLPAYDLSSSTLPKSSKGFASAIGSRPSAIPEDSGLDYVSKLLASMSSPDDKPTVFAANGSGSLDDPYGYDPTLSPLVDTVMADGKFSPEAFRGYALGKIPADAREEAVRTGLIAGDTRSGYYEPRKQLESLFPGGGQAENKARQEAITDVSDLYAKPGVLQSLLNRVEFPTANTGMRFKPKGDVEATAASVTPSTPPAPPAPPVAPPVAPPTAFDSDVYPGFGGPSVAPPVSPPVAPPVAPPVVPAGGSAVVPAGGSDPLVDELRRREELVAPTKVAPVPSLSSLITKFDKATYDPSGTQKKIIGDLETQLKDVEANLPVPKGMNDIRDRLTKRLSALDNSGLPFMTAAAAAIKGNQPTLVAFTNAMIGYTAGDEKVKSQGLKIMGDIVDLDVNIKTLEAKQMDSEMKARNALIGARQAEQKGNAERSQALVQMAAKEQASLRENQNAIAKSKDAAKAREVQLIAATFKTEQEQKQFYDVVAAFKKDNPGASDLDAFTEAFRIMKPRTTDNASRSYGLKTDTAADKWFKDRYKEAFDRYRRKNTGSKLTYTSPYDKDVIDFAKENNLLPSNPDVQAKILSRFKSSGTGTGTGNVNFTLNPSPAPK